MNISNTLKLLSVARAASWGFTGCDVDVHDDGVPHVDVVPDRTIDPAPADVDVDVVPDRSIDPGPVDVDVVPDGTNDPGPGNADIDVDVPGVDVDVNKD